MKCFHEFKPTGYIQTTYLGDDKNETEELKCQNCTKRVWVKAGTIPNTRKPYSRKANVVRGQKKLELIMYDESSPAPTAKEVSTALARIPAGVLSGMSGSNE